MHLIDAVRGRLQALGLDGFMVPCADPHFSEWVMPASRRLQRLTGFKGSAGTAVVLLDRLLLFTDGRYTDVAAEQVDARPLEIFNVRDHPLEETLASRSHSGFRLGYDAWVHTVADIERLQAVAARAGLLLTSVQSNPIDNFCEPPAAQRHPVRLHPEQFAGRSSVEKRRELAMTLRAAGADRVLLSSPESICWLLNIRGSDAEHTPLVYAFAIGHSDATVDLFIDLNKVGPELRFGMGPDVRLHAYRDLELVLSDAAPGQLLAMDPASTAQAALALALKAGLKVVALDDPCLRPKARKNPVEIAGAKACHRREGALLCRFWNWFEQESLRRPVWESELAARVDALRATDPLFHSISFETIPATGPNAAMPHYHVTAGSDRCLQSGEFVLLDSGGQYLDGTTDVTRTFSLGTPSHEMCERYTLVLRSFVRAAAARFPPLTRGIQIDAIARELFWREGVDFDHSLGHGVGSFLGVHEGPNRLRPNPTGLEPLRTGMITSIEPAFYAKGRFGVRIENLVVTEECASGGEQPMLQFTSLTCCPIDLRPVLLDRLDDRDRRWIDEYHGWVRGQLAPLLSGDDLRWLEGRTQPVATPRYCAPK